MSIIIDRRKTDKGKHTLNRGRFIRKAKDQIKESLKKNINKRSIKDTGAGGDVVLPSNGTSEPVFTNGRDGRKDFVLPGNKQFQKGDKIYNSDNKRERDHQGKDGSPEGEGLDAFVFTLSREEFLDILFEDLDLPPMIQKALKDIKTPKWSRAGFSPVGVPANLDITKTFVQSLARRFAIKGSVEKQIKTLQETQPDSNQDQKSIDAQIEVLNTRKKMIPFVDEYDLRYRLHVMVPQPVTQAVMICIMDVSGSMGEYEKLLSKKFFMLLYYFLERKYDKIDVVFIRHTTEAREVTEDEFFHSKESGGTMVSSALVLAKEIIDLDYPSNDWNIYITQCSDGDNYEDDNKKCIELLEHSLLPIVQYYAYVQIGHEFNQDYGAFSAFYSFSGLWRSYSKLAEENDKFKVRRVDTPADIYPVFRELFKKEIPNA